jgi:hypothetical protein
MECGEAGASRRQRISPHRERVNSRHRNGLTTEAPSTHQRQEFHSQVVLE